MDELLIELRQLQKDYHQLRLSQVEDQGKINDLINYNTKLPYDINKYFKMLKLQVEDLQDQADRIEEIVDVKITSKKEMSRLKLRVRGIEDDLILIKAKSLDIEDHLVGVEKSILKNRTECDFQYQELLLTVDGMQKPTNKNLQSKIYNTTYTIKKLTAKKNDNTITEKETKRLEHKLKLLEELSAK